MASRCGLWRHRLAGWHPSLLNYFSGYPDLDPSFAPVPIPLLVLFTTRAACAPPPVGVLQFPLHMTPI